MQDEENIAIDTFWLALSKIVKSVTKWLNQYFTVIAISLVAVVVFVVAIVIMARKRQPLDNISRVSFSKTKCFKDLAEDLWRMNVQKRTKLYE